MNTTFTQVLGIDLALFTIVTAHPTFCIVVVYNNVVARLRRVLDLLKEAGRPRRRRLADLPPRHFPNLDALVAAHCWPSRSP